MNENISNGLDRIVLVIATFIFVVSSLVLFFAFILDPPEMFRVSDLVVTLFGLSFFTFISTSIIGIVLYSCTWSYRWISEGFKEEERMNSLSKKIM